MGNSIPKVYLAAANLSPWNTFDVVDDTLHLVKWLIFG